jgi:hypothetical protein
MIEKRKRLEAQPYTLCLVCFSVMLMGKDTCLLHLLVPNLLTGGKRVDLVIRGNVVLNSIVLDARLFCILALLGFYFHKYTIFSFVSKNGPSARRHHYWR